MAIPTENETVKPGRSESFKKAENKKPLNDDSALKNHSCRHLSKHVENTVQLTWERSLVWQVSAWVLKLVPYYV